MTQKYKLFLFKRWRGDGCFDEENSKFPMFLFWGRELTCFYNDAFRPSLGEKGKHPALLGSGAADSWQEVWSHIKPIIDNVMAGVFLTCYETTNKVIADQELKTRTAELESSESRFRYLVVQSPVAIAVFRSRDLYIETVNPHMLKFGEKQLNSGKDLPCTSTFRFDR